MNAAAQRIRAAVINEFPNRISVGHYTAFRSLLLGAGLCYAIGEERYHHIPVTFLLPSIYAGYHLYKNKDAVAEWTRNKVLN